MRLVNFIIAFTVLTLSCNVRQQPNSRVRADAGQSQALSDLFADIISFTDEYCKEGITCKIESHFYKLPNLEDLENDQSPSLARKISKIKD
jgi:hypothetical protein